VCMILGDNIFFGHGLKHRLKLAVSHAEEGEGATIFVIMWMTRSASASCPSIKKERRKA
jgi:dTDP-glucose pyrophosphorylase